MKIVALSGAQAGYGGAPVLAEISLTVEAGERIAIVGESGAGKSTLLRLIREQSETPVALVPQDAGLVQALTVFHNVYMGRLETHGTLANLRNLIWPSRHEADAVRGILDELRLADKMFTSVGQLSGGQRQRTAVARALYATAPVFIGDEPVSAVDDHQARAVLELVVRKKETTIVAIHDRELALSFADRVIGLRAGTIVLDTPTGGMRATDLDHLYTA